MAPGVAEEAFASTSAAAAIAVPAATRDDRVLPVSRAVATLVIPFLLVAFGVLYVQPGVAAALFAWPIKPQLTAMLLGSAYLGGVVFFSFVLGTRRWHEVGLGFPPVAVFASLLMLTTLVHWALFSFDRTAGVTWVLIYVVAPPLVIAAWWLNRRRDPGAAPGEQHPAPSGDHGRPRGWRGRHGVRRPAVRDPGGVRRRLAVAPHAPLGPGAGPDDLPPRNPGDRDRRGPTAVVTAPSADRPGAPRWSRCSWPWSSGATTWSVPRSASHSPGSSLPAPSPERVALVLFPRRLAGRTPAPDADADAPSPAVP